jgi:hexulose-6-phosphate isomerase
MKKGINQWCYPKGTKLDDVLKWTKEAGFDAIELNVADTEEIGLTLNTSIDTVKAIRKNILDSGLLIESLSTNLLWKFPLSSQDIKVREKGKQVVRKMLQLAEAMDVDAILIVPGIVTAEVPYDLCYETSLESLRELLPDAEKAGITLGIENVWNHFLLSPLEMAAFVDACHSEYAGVYFDVGNVLQTGFPEQWIRILGKRIVKVHVKDFKKDVGTISGFTNLLAGDVNWKSVMDELKNIGYEGTVTAELTSYRTHPFALAQDTSRHLDYLLSLSK